MQPHSGHGHVPRLKGCGKFQLHGGLCTSYHVVHLCMQPSLRICFAYQSQNEQNQDMGHGELLEHRWQASVVMALILFFTT